MKQAIQFCIIFLPVLVMAQFPVPTSFQVNVNYIHLGESDWCDGQLVQGPTYCNLFSWETPDTANTPVTLAGYRIYKNSEFFLATSNTNADTSGGYMHTTLYVTAVYENPAGESEPSNSVYIGDLPVGTDEALYQEPIGIWFDPVQQALRVRGAERVRTLRVYDMQGKLVFSSAVSANQRLEGLPGGIYSIVIQDKLGGMYNQRVAIGF
jgi:hypothetical protein